MPPELDSFQISPNTAKPLSSFVSSTSDKRIYARASRHSRSRSLPNYRTQEQISRSQTACPQNRDNLCSSWARLIYSPTRAGASSPYQVMFSTQVRKLVPLPTEDNSPLAVRVTIDPAEEEGEAAVRSGSASHDYRHNGMGKDRRLANDPGLVKQWFPYKIQTVPASVPPRQQANAEGEQRLHHGSHTRMARTGSTREDTNATALHLSNSNGAEEGWKTPNDFKSQTPAPVRSGTTLQVREPRHAAGYLTTRRLVQLPRPAKRFLPRARTPRVSAISWVPVERKLLPVRRSAIRTICQPVGIHNNDAESHEAHKILDGYLSNVLRRRLVAHRGFSPGVRLANRASDSAVSPPPTSDQQGEVFPPSGPERGLSGDAIGHVITPCAGPSTIRQTTHDSQDNEPPAVRFSGETSPCTCRCTSCRTNNCSNEVSCASKTHATGIIPRFGEGS